MSIRRYLVLILVSIITLISFIAAIQGYKASMVKASHLFDAQLRSVANTLIALKPKQALVNVNSNDNLAFQFWQKKHLISKTSNVPFSAISAFNQGFSDNNFNGKRWRVFTKINKVDQTWIMVAQSIKPRFELAEKVIVSAVTPIILAIPILSLIISLVVSQGLRPLNQLTKQLTKKKINDLSVISIEKTSKELIPVIDTLNWVFAQLDSAYEREKRFASDAAHELRTPLSVLKINAHNLQYELGEDHQSLNHLVASVDRMAHVVDQILKLNRTNPEQFNVQMQKVALKPLIQQVIGQLYPEIISRHQQIEFNHGDVVINGNEFSLITLLQNLIANASKYSPDGGHILVTTLHVANRLILKVEDSGSGIAEQEMTKVFERFYRIGGDRHNSNVVGCGLGLSIVKHIVELHNATISLAKSKNLHGLMVTVIFPVSHNKNIEEPN
jgi:two-component system, OmpR family, sensor kinase